MKTYRSFVSLILLHLFLCTGVFAKQLQLLGFVDPYQCSSCNQLSIVLKHYPEVVREIKFIYSSDVATVEQAQEFLNDMTGLSVSVTINNRLYNRLRELYAGSRTPYIALYDSMEDRVVYSISMDSLEMKVDVLKKVTAFHAPYRFELIDNPRISRLIGWKNIAILDSNLFVSSYQNTSKIFYLNVYTHQYDSIYLTDSLLQRVYAICGIKSKVSDVRTYWEQHELPMPLYRFSSDLDVDGPNVNTYVDLYYYDPAYAGDTFIPKWYSLVASFNPQSKQLKLSQVKSFELNTKEEVYSHNTLPIYSPDFTLKRRINDTLWVFSSDKVERDKDSTNKTKLLLNYAFDRKLNLFKFHSFRDSLVLKDVRTFRGKNFNNYHTYFYYTYKAPYMFFAESDQVYNLETHKQISLKEQLKGVSWVFDLAVSDNTLTVLCQENTSHIVVYVLERNTLSVLAKEQVFDTRLGSLMNNLKAKSGLNMDADLKYSSNLGFNGTGIFYLNRAGKIVHVLLD